ncbi:MAG: MarR family transcriptional regulator [Gemmatimonadota bacterium]|nr:MAG: MarR family transcriptional regulator [Gemmatimonadota bacterium]
MEMDTVDRAIEDWGRERPDVDAQGLGVVSRIVLLAKLFGSRDKRALAPLGLAPWAADVLLTLRRQGPPFELSPTRLRKYAVLTSGAMTTRLDRLEEAGYVRRSMDPRDRRGILVSLTEEGRELADRAVEARLGEVRRALGTLAEGERRAVEAALRSVLVNLQRDSIVPP